MAWLTFHQRQKRQRGVGRVHQNWGFSLVSVLVGNIVWELLQVYAWLLLKTANCVEGFELGPPELWQDYSG